MHHFPRQASSGGAASSSDATTSAAVPTSESVNALSATTDAIGSQTSSLTSAATSGQLSSSTNPVSSSRSADLTTSSSTPSSPSTSPSSNTVSTSTTSDVASSSSIASRTTSSAPSSVSSSQPPTSSSQQETTTTITSAYTTYIDGSQILTSTSFPSTIPELSSPSTSSNRTAIIAGSAAGGTAFIILILSFAFCVRRKRFKRVHFLDTITLKRKQARSRATLLDGEDLDNVGRLPHGYTDYEMPWDGNDHALMGGRRTLDTPAPTLPSRWAESGSAFREEVWPPPNEATRLMDPLANRDNLNIDLSRIVDDVMGPSHARTHFSDQSVSSIHRGSMADSQGVHSRTASNASNAALLEAAGLGGSASTAPVRPSPLAQQRTTPASVEDQGGYT